MKWLQRLLPWRRPRCLGIPRSGDQEEAAEALRDANRKLDEARCRRSEVEEVAESLRFHRHQNHFAELFRESLGRTP